MEWWQIGFNVSILVTLIAMHLRLAKIERRSHVEWIKKMKLDNDAR